MSMSIKPKLRVYVGVPSGDTVKAGFSYDLARMMAATAINRPDVELRLGMVQDSILPRGRSEIVAQALHSECTHILFLDSDMRFPKHTLARLLNASTPIVAASYVTRGGVPVLPVAHLSDDHDARLYTEPQSAGLAEVASVGMGCMLVACDVFRGIPAPWFMFGFQTAAGEYIGEDVYFCRLARESGLSVLIDHELSREVGHLGEWEYRHDHALATRPAVSLEPVASGPVLVH